MTKERIWVLAIEGMKTMFLIALVVGFIIVCAEYQRIHTEYMHVRHWLREATTMSDVQDILSATNHWEGGAR